MIERIESYLPSSTLTNTDLQQIYHGWAAEKIFEKTGIRSRHIASNNECASDLAYHAAENLLSKIDRDEIDFLVFCTQSPDFFLPTTACLLQERLRLRTGIGAFDFNLGCSGYIYGLALAQSLIQTKQARKVLLLNADTYSRYIHPYDKSTRTIFGDGAAATLLDISSKQCLSSFVYGTDGSGAEQLIVRTGAGRACRIDSPSVVVDQSGNVRDPNCISMNGPEVFNFTIQTVPRLVSDVLARAGLSLENVDFFVFHQANAYMLEHLRRRLKIPSQKFWIFLEQCGNTVSASIPIALEAALKAGKIRTGMKVLLAGFGVGLSWAGCILEWNSDLL